MAQAQPATYVDFRMQEWRMAEQSKRIQTCVRRVLNELESWALICLKDPRFEVIVMPESDHNVRAYFPIHDHEDKKFIAERRAEYIEAIREVAAEQDHAQILAVAMQSDAELRSRLAQQTEPAIQAVLILSTVHFEKGPVRQLEDQLRHHIGHTLIYLRDPNAPNYCRDADKEWRAARHVKVRTKKARERR